MSAGTEALGTSAPLSLPLNFGQEVSVSEAVGVRDEWGKLIRYWLLIPAL